jgi:hypothetical protein
MKKIKNLKDIPPAWATDENEEIILELDLNEDPWVALYSTWRQFVSSLTDEEKRVVKKWACGTKEPCSKEEINDWVSATKGSLNKK